MLSLSTNAQISYTIWLWFIYYIINYVQTVNRFKLWQSIVNIFLSIKSEDRINISQHFFFDKKILPLFIKLLVATEISQIVFHHRVLQRLDMQMNPNVSRICWEILNVEASCKRFIHSCSLSYTSRKLFLRQYEYHQNSEDLEHIEEAFGDRTVLNLLNLPNTFVGPFYWPHIVWFSFQ